MTYRRKPQTVEAIQFTDNNASKCEAFLGEAHSLIERNLIFFANPEGIDCAHPGDWIIKDSSGNFSSISASIFRKMYEPAN